MSWSGEPRPVILTKYSGRLPPGRYSRAAALAEIEWIQTEKIDPLESQLKKRLDGRTRRGTETRHDRWEDELSHIHAAVSKPLIGSAYNGTAATSDGTKPCGRIGCLNIISEFDDYERGAMFGGLCGPCYEIASTEPWRFNTDDDEGN